MPLPGATLLPNALLPLFIFEPRYRMMLAEALRTDRVFCVAQSLPGVEEVREDRDIEAVAGLGLVRACVGHPDGTSHLILQGMTRVRIHEFVRRKPYRVARVEALPSRLGEAAVEEELRLQLVAVCGRIRESGVRLPPVIERTLEAPIALDTLADLVAGSFVLDPVVRQRLLEETEVAARTRLLLAALRRGE